MRYTIAIERSLIWSASLNLAYQIVINEVHNYISLSRLGFFDVNPFTKYEYVRFDPI